MHNIWIYQVVLILKSVIIIQCMTNVRNVHLVNMIAIIKEINQKDSAFQRETMWQKPFKQGYNAGLFTSRRGKAGICHNIYY